MKDELGQRMKDFYESRSKTKLLRRSFTILRIDGKAFHTYTRGLTRPFDDDLIEDMNLTAAYLCKNIMGAKLAYVQSDEISILVTDFDTITTQAWFDYNVQKMCSVAASMATSEFNKLRLNRLLQSKKLKDIHSVKMAEFDARVFQLPSLTETINYFIWRQQDATRNSISSVAQSLYSHKELNGKSTSVMQEMIFQKNINWNDYDFRKKRGGCIKQVQYVNYKPYDESWVKLIDGEYYEVDQTDSDNLTKLEFPTIRNKWELVETPIFSQNKEFFNQIIPCIN